MNQDVGQWVLLKGALENVKPWVSAPNTLSALPQTRRGLCPKRREGLQSPGPLLKTHLSYKSSECDYRRSRERVREMGCSTSNYTTGLSHQHRLYRALGYRHG